MNGINIFASGKVLKNYTIKRDEHSLKNWINMNFEFQPIGKDVTNVYGFVFGRYRYQVEWFDHKKEKENVPGMLVVFDYWDSSVKYRKIF